MWTKQLIFNNRDKIVGLENEKNSRFDAIRLERKMILTLLVNQLKNSFNSR